MKAEGAQKVRYVSVFVLLVFMKCIDFNGKTETLIYFSKDLRLSLSF